MVAMVQRLDARSFFFHAQLSDSIFLALVLKVCRDCFSCHGQSVAEPAPCKLSNLALCHRFAIISGLVEVRGCRGFLSTNAPIRRYSFSKQSKGMSNFVQSPRAL